jgi:hypothetical protein
VFVFGGCAGFPSNRIPFWISFASRANESKSYPGSHDLIKEVHPQVNEIKEGMEEMIAVVKENSENNPPASQKKGH